MLNLYDFISDSSLFKKFRIDDLLFVEYHCVLDELKTGYWTPCNYLIYILSGKKHWKSLGKEVTGHPGDAVFFKKGAYVAEKFVHEEFCSLLIFLPDDFISTVMRKHGLKNPGSTMPFRKDAILNVEVDKILESYFLSVFSYFSRQQPPSKNLLKVKFEEFIINILSNNNNPVLSSYFDHIRSSNRISIREVMEKNYPYNMNLEEYAKLSGRSLSTFHRDFKKEYGKPPGKWLTQRRLEHARLLLETTEMSINEISFDSGFENPSHFIRVFKEKYNRTPRKFQLIH